MPGPVSRWSIPLTLCLLAGLADAADCRVEGALPGGGLHYRVTWDLQRTTPAQALRELEHLLDDGTRLTLADPDAAPTRLTVALRDATVATALERIALACNQTVTATKGGAAMRFSPHRAITCEADPAPAATVVVEREPVVIERTRTVVVREPCYRPPVVVYAPPPCIVVPPPRHHRHHGLEVHVGWPWRHHHRDCR